MTGAYTTSGVLKDQSAILLNRMAMHANNLVKMTPLDAAITSRGLRMDSIVDFVFIFQHAALTTRTAPTVTQDPHQTTVRPTNGPIDTMEEDEEDASEVISLKA